MGNVPGWCSLSFQKKFNSIQNSLFSTQHIVHTPMFCFAYDVLKRERAEDRAYVGSFPIMIKKRSIHNY